MWNIAYYLIIVYELISIGELRFGVTTLPSLYRELPRERAERNALFQVRSFVQVFCCLF